MKWLEKYRIKQQKKYEELRKKQNSYQIPDEYLKHPLFEGYNEVIAGKFSKEVGEELEKLYSDDDNVICIHRTMLNLENYKNQIDDIFEYGLINNSGPDHEYTLTPLKHFPLVITQVLTSCHYRQGTCKGGIIAVIPKKDLGLKEGEPKPIWFRENDYKYRLLNEYIYGYISSKEDGENIVKEIYRNPNYKKNHDYQNDGLYYDKKLQLKNDKIR